MQHPSFDPLHSNTPPPTGMTPVTRLPEKGGHRRHPCRTHTPPLSTALGGSIVCQFLWNHDQTPHGAIDRYGSGEIYVVRRNLFSRSGRKVLARFLEAVRARARFSRRTRAVNETLCCVRWHMISHTLDRLSKLGCLTADRVATTNMAALKPCRRPVLKRVVRFVCIHPARRGVAQLWKSIREV